MLNTLTIDSMQTQMKIKRLLILIGLEDVLNKINTINFFPIIERTTIRVGWDSLKQLEN